MSGLIVSMIIAARAHAQGMPPALAQFLQQSISLKSDEINAASSGTPVVKVLDPSDQREVAVFGIVSIGVTRSFYVERVTDFPSALRDPTRLHYALFSDPAVASDAEAFSLPHDDLQDLAKCQPHSCKLKLPADAIVRLRATLDPPTPSADSMVNAYFRSHMVSYATGYRARGNAALLAYDDQRSADSAGMVFTALLSRSPYMYQYAPSLQRYLVNYPSDRPARTREAIYWSEDDLPGLKPTLTITHEVVYAPSELPGSTLIATKLLYADHYLDGALGLTAVVDGTKEGTAGDTGIYLVVLRRLHFDDLPSGGIVNVRGKVVGKLRDQMTASLRSTKSRLEQAYAATHQPR
ncbi:MAG TPA: hypothetical protein VK511_00580 [Gemmatimonadaceae bacterium]|nr:hypothetical protein [Gemmatimonadaceae bacterium]